MQKPWVQYPVPKTTTKIKSEITKILPGRLSVIRAAENVPVARKNLHRPSTQRGQSWWCQEVVQQFHSCTLAPTKRLNHKNYNKFDLKTFVCNCTHRASRRCWFYRQQDWRKQKRRPRSRLIISELLSQGQEDRKAQIMHWLHWVASGLFFL